MHCPTCRRFTPPGAPRCPACGTLYNFAGGAKSARNPAGAGSNTPRPAKPAPLASLSPSPGAAPQVNASLRSAAAAALVNQAARLQSVAHQALPCPNPSRHPHPLAQAATSGIAAPRSPASSTDPQVLSEGTVLGAGHYWIGPLLGRGSFGITYRGLDQRLNRAVAIKEFFPEGSVRHAGTIVPPASLGRDGYELERGHFIEEARVLAHFQRPGIVTVYEVFQENDTAYMVMEHIAGRTLVELLKERGRPLPPADALRYILAVADALAAVHARHLLHRDVKPGNIMITPDDKAVLIDFGAARRFDRYQRTSAMTAIGTPGYAPLEQWGSSGRFGPASDVYALAATLYHLLTGQMPPSSADRATNDTLVPPSELNPAVPAAVSDAIVVALSVRMDDRPQTMASFAASLRSARQSRTQTRSSTQPLPARQPAQSPPGAAPQMALQVSGPQAGQMPAAQVQHHRRHVPWPRRRRDRVLWASGFIFVPAALAVSLLALAVVVPLLALCSAMPSWRARRLSRRWFRRSLRLGMRGLGLCAVSAVSLALVAAIVARTVVRVALRVVGLSLRLIG